MEWRNFPSLNALRAFSVVAETGSYTQAGERLNVTHAAVMQQIRGLEAFLDVQLVERSGRKLELSQAGRQLARDLHDGFRVIHQGVDALTRTQAARPLHVTMSPVFAVKWLMPRLAEFQIRHPEVTLLLNPSGKIVDVERDDMDLAIRYSRLEDLPPGAEVLIVLDLAIVGTPELLASAPVVSPADLARLPWLMELGTQEVPEWFARQGVTPAGPLTISHMPGNLIMEAVKQGEGITYTARQWVSEELASGVLVDVFAEVQAGAFYLHPRSGPQRPALRAFMAWLRSASQSERNL